VGEIVGSMIYINTVFKQIRDAVDFGYMPYCLTSAALIANVGWRCPPRTKYQVYSLLCYRAASNRLLRMSSPSVIVLSSCC